MEFLESLRQYFRGEKLESMLILAGSAILLAAGGGLLASTAGPFARGLGGVLLLTGLIGAVVGGTIVFRTDRQVAELTELYERDVGGFVAAEGSRIRKVVRSFRTYRIAYAVAVVAALALALSTRVPVLHGVALGLVVFAAFGLTVDHYAEARAIRYAEKVHGQVPHTRSG